jgi:plasmid maintenance system antidote protein VapI
MSLFGEHLRVLIDSNKVNIYGLAKSAGIERTAIHKIISGDRIPSDDYANKLADAMPLSPEERQRFWDSYNISKIGKLKYSQRLQVKNLVESIAYIENGIIAPQGDSDISTPPSAFL